MYDSPRTQLHNHFHPSVQHFARRLLDGAPIEYLGDPLADFGTMAFLDRFMYKNPKQLEPWRRCARGARGVRSCLRRTRPRTCSCTRR